MASRVALLLLLLSMPLACGEEPVPPSLVPSSANPRHNVLLYDDGIDPAAPAFRGKVAGLYTVVCNEAPSEPADGGADPDAGAGDGADAGSRFEAAKARWLADFARKDDSCHLRPGIDPKPDPLAQIARFRDTLNASIRAGRYWGGSFTPSQVEEIERAFDDAADAHVHGTATAGTIAHENPLVRLVLVETALGDAEKNRAEFTCLEQADIDLTVSLLSDPEIRQAYVEQPSSTLADDLRDVRTRHRIGVMNESFGYFTRQLLEELQRMKGCRPVDLVPYFTTYGEVEAAWASAHPDDDLLMVKSAGNEHTEVNGPADKHECAPGPSPRLMVGSYEDNGRLTDFTNFGACVDVFAPGRSIIAPIPGGWYTTMSGTSFSAPLVVRMVTLTAGPFNAGAARAAVVAARDGRHRIPIARFPRSVLFDPEGDAFRFSSTIAGAPARQEPPRFEMRHLRRHLRLLKP